MKNCALRKIKINFFFHPLYGLVIYIARLVAVFDY